MKGVFRRPFLILFLCLTLLLTTSPFIGIQQASAEPHVSNPFLGATNYVNPAYANSIEQAIGLTTDSVLQGKMRTIQNYSTAIWLDRIGNIAPPGGLSVGDHLDNALLQKQPNVPITIMFVIYNLPGRDCAALASMGELPLSAAGLQQYKTDYIDVIASYFSNPKYKDIRIVTVIEPDGLPNLVTNLSDPECSQAKSTGIYVQGVQYALNKLSAIPNVYNYLDIGHSGWLGWDSNLSGVVNEFTTAVQGTTRGFASVDGFITNVSNYTPVEEPFLPNPNLNRTGGQVRSSTFYEWNSRFDEADYTQALYNAFVNKGWPSGTGFLIDTSRNGWGGPNRPAAVSTSTLLNPYVEESKIDRRAHRGLWCNLDGAGMGYAPQATPSGFGSHIDAFVWVKPPGESDGASTPIPNDQGKLPDENCDPNYLTTHGSGNIYSGAMANAPLAGHWFQAQFEMLINNAYPEIPAGLAKPVITQTPRYEEGFVAVKWDAVPGATRYEVSYTHHFRPDGSFGDILTITQGNGLGLGISGLLLGEKYYVKVRAIGENGLYSESIAPIYTFHLQNEYKGSTVHISWNSLAPHDTTTYKVRYAASLDGPWTFIPNVYRGNNRKEQLTSIAPVIKYVQVVAYDANNNAFAVTNPVKANDAWKFTFLSHMANSLSMAWTLDPGMNRYGIERLTDKKLHDTFLTNVVQNSGTVLDGTATAGKTLWYRLSSFEGDNKFYTVKRNAKSGAPGDFSATISNPNQGKIRLAWSASANASKYTIYRKDTAYNWNPWEGAGVKIAEVSGTTLSFIDHKFNGSFVDYRIVAENNNGTNVAYVDSWIVNSGPFYSGFESGDWQTDWTNSVWDNRKQNVSGYFSYIEPELGRRSNEITQGASQLMFSGSHNRSNHAFVYLQAFDVNIPVTGTTKLSYKFMPQTEYSRNVAVEIVTTDGIKMRDIGVTSTTGVPMRATYPKGTINQWTTIETNLSQWLSGKTIDKILVVYDYHYQESTNKTTDIREAGQFRGYIDDLKIWN